MNQITLRKLVVSLIILTIISPSPFIAQQTQLDRTPPVLRQLDLGRGRGLKEVTYLDKLAPELRTLFRQFTRERGGTGTDESGIKGYTSRQLNELFGIEGAQKNPNITVALNFLRAPDVESVRKAGASILFKNGKTIYAIVRVEDLFNLANISEVRTIGVFTAMHIPAPPKIDRPPEFRSNGRGSGASAASTEPLANAFNKQNLSGKGVIVGVIDSGIDWKHKDFRRPDGTSRILALWDLSDDSFQKSNGTTGSQPPVYLEKEKAWYGTVYTNAQINAALNGRGQVNSLDRFGHGTAVAGTAAGNSTTDARFNGVAPEADLIVVKAMNCEYFFPLAELTANWIAEKAKELKKPVVINMSFGGQFGAHDGTTDGEQFIDWLSGKGKQGVIVTASAGNDGRFNVHSAGKFGKNRPGQVDNFSAHIDLRVKEPSRLLGVFNSQDDWGIVFRTNHPDFVDASGKPIDVFLFKNGNDWNSQTSADPKDPQKLTEFLSSVEMELKGGVDVLQMQLPAGEYTWWAYGTGPKVQTGAFDLYLVDPASLNKASFGTGVIKDGIVGSPGTAANAITVGSFDFRTSWENLSGQTTFYNLEPGGISDYTSNGFRRDGVVKPDISAPARYTISPLSEDARPTMGGCTNSMAAGEPANFTKDGSHLAWAGTSAAAPFTAGVIALMLQKNPTLDAAQVRQILQKTARKGPLVGAVPNTSWGWGMLNPAAALNAVPRVRVVGKMKSKKK